MNKLKYFQTLNSTLLYKKASNIKIFSKSSHKKFCNKIDPKLDDTNNKVIKKSGLMGKIKQCGKFGIIFYASYCVLGFLGFYFLLEYKFIKISSVVDFCEKNGIDKYIDIRKKVNDNPKFSNVIAAYLMNQIFEVIRLPTTVLFLTYYMKKFKK